MKNRLLIGILTVVLGLVLVIGPLTFLPNCGEGMPCFFTAHGEPGVGGVIAVLGLLLLVFKNPSVRLGLSAAAALNGILALLLPGVLIGVCHNPDMSCRTLTLPALLILSGLVTVVSVVNVVYLWKITKGAHQNDKTADDHQPLRP